MICSRAKYVLVSLGATLTLVLAVGTASANRLSVSNKAFRFTWRSMVLNPGGVACPVTFEGSFHSATISKAVGALIGHISRATASPAVCTNGDVRFLQEQLPWHVQYGGFEGSLPSITGIRVNLIGAATNVCMHLLGFCCLYTTSQATPSSLILRLSAGVITSVRADETRVIPLISGFCVEFGNASLSGEGRVSLLGNTSSITVRLI